jgi:hypothetical protein
MDVECLEGRNRFRNEEIRVPNGNFASKEQEALLKQESLLKDTCMKNFQCFVKGEIPPFGKNERYFARRTSCCRNAITNLDRPVVDQSIERSEKKTFVDQHFSNFLIFVKTLNSIQHHMIFFKADAMNPNESVLLIS